LLVSTFFHFVAFVSLLSFSKHLFLLLCCCIFFHVTLFECCLYIATFVFPSTFHLFLCCCVLLVLFFWFSSSLFVFHLLCKIILPWLVLHFYHTSFFAHFFFCYNFLSMLHFVLCKFQLWCNSTSLLLSMHNFSIAHWVISFIFFWIYVFFLFFLLCRLFYLCPFLCCLFLCVHELVLLFIFFVAFFICNGFISFNLWGDG
jgi:hypothetical protein